MSKILQIDKYRAKANTSTSMTLIPPLAALSALAALPGLRDGSDPAVTAALMQAEKTPHMMLEEPPSLDQALARMNSRFIFIESPTSIIDRQTREIMRRIDFMHRTENIHVKIETPDGAKRINVGREWLQWSKRNQASGLAFAPGEDTFLPDRKFNLWQGWSVEPKPGDVAPGTSCLITYSPTTNANATGLKSGALIRFDTPVQNSSARLCCKGRKVPVKASLVKSSVDSTANILT